MQYATYSFYCRFTSATHVSAFKGSAIRGLFGLVLKKTVCALRLKECDSCILQKRCVYFQMFETQKTGAVNKRGKILSSALPHPFVLEPPLDLEQTYQAGDSFVLGLTLFGNAVEYLPSCCSGLDPLMIKKAAAHGYVVVSSAVTAQTEGDAQIAADVATQLNEVARELNEICSGFRV